MNFVEMDYLKIYNQLIEKRKNYVLSDDEKFEVHHIVPVSCGGESIKDNLVRLTPREHFIAHKLLHIIYPNNNSLKYAYCMMTHTTLDAIKNYKKCTTYRYYKVSGRDYEYCRKLSAELCKDRFKGTLYINNGQKQKAVKLDKINEYLNQGWILGKLPFSKEALQSIRQKNKNRILSEDTHIKKSNSVSGSKNPAYGTKMMHKNNINKRVLFDEVDLFLKDGWILGMAQSKKFKNQIKIGSHKGKKDNNKGRIYVHNEEEPYLIRFTKPENLDYYLNVLCWKLGQGPYKAESKKNNGNTGNWMYIQEPEYKTEKIQKELQDLYISRGWKFGKLSYLKNKL